MTLMQVRSATTAIAFGCALMAAGCANEKPQSVTTPGLDTGITASSGGAMQNRNYPIPVSPRP